MSTETVTLTMPKDVAFSLRIATNMRYRELRDLMDNHVGQRPLCRYEHTNLEIAMRVLDSALDRQKETSP